MKSSLAGGACFSRRFSKPMDSDHDPWNEFANPSSGTGEVKMAFEDDFHLTVIPNFLHDSDAYVANLENKLECLRQVNKNPTAKEMLAAMTSAKALRMKDAQLNPEPTGEATNEEEDNGLLTLWPFLFLPISRRLFPRSALNKEETLHLLKCDHLNMQFQDELNNNNSDSNDNNTANEGYEIKHADTPPDTSWERRQRDSSAEQPVIVYENPEANDLQIPKNWVDDEIQPEGHQGTCAQLDDIINVRPTTNRSALSLSATNSPTTVQQPDASTLTSMTPSKRSEEAFYHFAYIMTSATSTQDSARPGSPAEYFSCSKMTVQDHVPFTSTSDVNTRKERFTTLPEHDTTVETNACSNLSANVSEVDVKEEAVIAAQPTPLQDAEDNAQCKYVPAEDGNEGVLSDQIDDDKHDEKDAVVAGKDNSAAVAEADNGPGEDKDNSAAVVEAGNTPGEDKDNSAVVVEADIEQGEDKDNSAAVVEVGNKPEDDNLAVVDKADNKPGEEKNIEEQAESLSVENKSGGTSQTNFDCKDSTTRPKTAQDMILPEVTVASSSSKESVARQEEEKKQRLGARTRQDGSRRADLTIPEYTVASSSMPEGVPVGGVEGPWLFEKEFDTSLGKNCGEDVLQRMSSLVRASMDEDDDGMLNIGTNQQDEFGARLSLTGGYSGRTRSKASEGTSGNYTTNYSDPHSNQLEEDSDETKKGGPAPIIRMFGQRAHDLKTALQSNLRTWAQRRGTDCSPDSRDDDASPPRMPHEDSDTVKRLVSENDAPHSGEYECSASTVLRYHQEVKEMPRRARDNSRQALRISVSPSARRKASSARPDASSDHGFETSAMPSPTPTMPQRDGKNTITQVPWAGGKLSTSSTFKNRQRSVHWLNSVYYVGSGTVVKECDYLSGSQEKIKDKSAVKGKTSTVASECDLKETSTTDDNYGQATLAAQKEMCGQVAVSAVSLPRCVEASQSEVAAIREVCERLQAITPKEEKTAAIYILEPSESFDSVLDGATSSVSKVRTIEQEGIPCPSIHQLETVEKEPRRDCEETVTHEGKTSTARPTISNLCSNSSISLTQETTIPQEELAATSANGHQETPDRLPDDEARERDDAQVENFTPLACTSQAPKPSPRQERKPEHTDTARGSASSSNALFLGTSRDKRDTTASEPQSRCPVPPPNRDTTVLHSHELVPSGLFSTFPAPNRASVLVHRYINGTRTLRMTTTKQFKRLSFKNCIASTFGHSSTSMECPFGAQTRQIVLPRALVPLSAPHQKMLSIEYKDCSTTRRPAVKSASCKNIDEASSVNATLSELPLVHKSFSVDGAVLEEADGHETPLQGSPAKGAAAEHLVATDDVKATSSDHSQLKSEGSVITKESITLVGEPSEVQLPPKKCDKLRLSEVPHCADECTEDTATGGVDILKADGGEEVLVDEVSTLLRIEFSDLLEGDDDKAFGNREYLAPGRGHCDNTISLVPESQYSRTSVQVEESQVAPPLVVANSDANLPTTDLRDSMPPACECTVRTEPNCDPLQSASASNVSADCRLSITDGDKNAGVGGERSPVVVAKPIPKRRRKRGGEKNASGTTVDSTSTSATSVLSEGSTSTEDSSFHLQIFSDTKAIFASQSYSDTSYGL